MDIFRTSHLAMELIAVTIRELFYLQSSPVDIYVFRDSEFHRLIRKGAYIDVKFIKKIIEDGHNNIFVRSKYRHLLVEAQQENLRTLARSFSMGDSYENAKKLLNLVSLNLRYLFEDPTNDETLNLQYQSLKILFNFLFRYTKKHEDIYKYFVNQGHHYIFAQPFLSSLFLIGILKTAHIYSQKDIENLFITSYFKDIGMCAIPVEKFDEENLSDNDKEILSKHPINSVIILKGRLPLPPNFFEVIESHHGFSLLKRELGTEPNFKDNLQITGIETILVNITDIIAAMISTRPYREAESLYDALKLVSEMISPQYPTEFKLIVGYFRNFFTIDVS